MDVTVAGVPHIPNPTQECPPASLCYTRWVSALHVQT